MKDLSAKKPKIEELSDITELDSEFRAHPKASFVQSTRGINRRKEEKKKKKRGNKERHKRAKKKGVMKVRKCSL
jgi:hypothetical protein